MTPSEFKAWLDGFTHGKIDENGWVISGEFD